MKIEEGAKILIGIYYMRHFVIVIIWKLYKNFVRYTLFSVDL